MATINGNDSSNIIVGTNAGDVINANGGSDTVLGGNGNDTIDGGSGDDLLSGGNGNDTILGGSGADTLSGGNGNDTLDGGSGSDLVSGGNGNDLLIYRVAENATSYDVYDGGNGKDTLRIFVSQSVYNSAAFQSDLAQLNAKLCHGSASDYLESIGLLVTSIEKVEIFIEGNPNQAPTDIALTNDTVAENAAGAVIGTLSTVDPNAGDTHSYTVSDSRFEVVGGQLKLKAGDALDFEAGSTISVDVTSTDGGGLSITEAFTIHVTNVNEAPTVSAAVTGGGAEESGNASINLLDFASDVDNGAVLHVENVVWDEVPGNMPAGFSLVGNAIVVDTNSLAYNAMAVGESFATHFTYNVVDEHGASTVQHATVTITGTNDAPTVSAAVTGGGAEGPGNASINLLDFASDVDNGAVLHVENVVWDEVPGNMPAGFSLVGNVIVVDTNSLAYNAMAVGETFATHFTYNVVDEPGASTVQHATVTITGTNDGPVAAVDTNGGDAVVEAGVNPGNTPFAGDASASGNVLDNDSDVDNGDSLTVTTTGTIQGVYGSLNLAADGSWTYTLNNADGDTDALAQGESASDVFSYTIADQHGATSSSTLTINITGTNDAPVITGGDTSGSVQEDTASQATGELAAFDPDNGAILTWMAQGGTSSANADFLFAADSLTIARNGNPTFFVDSFSDGNPPPSVPAGTTTASGYGGSGVNGLQEAGGRLIMDSDNAVPFEGVGSPDPIVGLNAVAATQTVTVNITGSNDVR